MPEAFVLTSLGWVASPLMKMVLDKASHHLGTDFEKRRKKLEDTVLPKLSLAIEKAENDKNKEKLVNWLRRLKDAYYEAEEAIDLLEYEKLKQKVKDDRKTLNERGTPISLPLNFVPPIKNALDKVKHGLSVFSTQKKMLMDCIDNLIEIAEEVKDFRNLLEGPKNANGSDADRATPSDPPSSVFGREKDKENIVNLLTQKPSNSEPGTSTSPAIPIIAITGRSGVGKTALAQYVCKHMDGQEHFHLCVWVHVPRKFEAPDVIKNMIQIIKKKEADKNDYPSTSLEALSIELKMMLGSKKLLLVLDDFWSEIEGFVKQWEDFIKCLSSCLLAGSRIILTTQLKNPLENAGLPDVTVETHNIEEIEGGPFLDLFMHYAWPNNSHLPKEEFQKIGQKIAVKLKGDPGAAKLVGGQLRGKLDLRHWEETAENDWLGDDMKSRIWSYQQLSLDLQRCFAFCSFFPKGFKIHGKILIGFWMAEGLIRTNDNEERLDDIGEKYLQELVSRFFLEQIAEEEGCYQLHDLLHDLAERVQGDDLIRIDYLGVIPSRLNENTRHISLPSSMINKLSEKKSFLENVRTFQVLDDGGFVEMKVLEEILKHMKKLRVLELHECRDELPESIGKLKHLRYLLFGHKSGPLKKLPNSICELYHLKTLALLTNCESLPEKFCELISLRDLALSNETLSHISHVGRLTSLQSLFLYVVRKKRGHELHQLKNLNQLRGSICIQGLENVGSIEDAVKANMENKEHLEEVRFEWKSDERDKDNVIGLATQHVQLLDALQPHRNISAVTLIGFGGYRLPTWLLIQNSLPKCRKLVLRELENLIEIVPVLENLTEMPSLPPNLCELELSRIQTITSLPPREVLNSMKNLKSLTIEKCLKLSSLGGIGDVTTLKELKLFHCFDLNLSNEPLPSSLETLAIVLYDSLVTELLFPCSNVDVALDVGSLSHLKELKLGGWVGRLEGLNSLNALHYLGVVKCPRINPSSPVDKYTFQLHEATFDYLVQLKLILSDESISSIKRLKICNFQGDSSDDAVFQSLTSLKELSVASFNGTHLPKNLKNLASVSSMEIVNCPNLCELELEELPRNLLRVEIEDCPTLMEKVNKGGPYHVRSFEGRTTLTFPILEGKETVLGRSN